MKRTSLFLIAVFSLMISGCMKNADEIGLSTKTDYTGQIISSNNVPIANARVSIYDGNSTYSRMEKVVTYSDESGRFLISVDYQRMDFREKPYLVVNKNGYKEESRLVPLGQKEYDFGTIRMELQ